MTHTSLFTAGNPAQSEMTADPSKYPQGRFKDKPCRVCGNTFSPRAPSHLHCSQDCKDRAHDSHILRKKYGITLDDYDAMVQEQGGVCAMCGDPPSDNPSPHVPNRLCIDHCHTTGKVRGLLCVLCNVMLGNARDDVARLAAGIEYLNRNN